MDGKSRNGLLAALSKTDYDRLKPDLSPLDLPIRFRLAEAGKPMKDMYFLTEGIASTVGSIRHDIPIEIGVTGREGFLGLPVVLGADRSLNETYMQVPGRGLRIPADKLRAAMAARPTLAVVLQRFVHAFMAQTASSVLANGRGSLEARLSRWLLMAHDRVDGDDVPVTHEFLSIMLGVRRPSVTSALTELERRMLVVRRRASVAVRDRTGLEQAANGYYGAAEDEYRRLFGRALSRT